MDWLSLQWISDYWMPLAVALLLGFILGWLFTGLPAGRRVGDAELRSADLDARARKAERDLADAKRETEAQRSRLLSTGDDLDKARARLRELEATVTALRDEKAALEARVDEAEAWATADRTEIEEAVDYEGPDAGDIASSFAAAARATDATPAPSAKDIALDEAFTRAAALQRTLEERDTILAMRQAELETVKSELLTSNAARRELEARLVRAREDVAAELAVLASTMIKMKDDALARAEARYAALQSEADTLRLAADRATQTAD